MKKSPLTMLLALTLLWAAPTRADVKLNGTFADHMVLQRGARVPVWGTAAPGEDISVSIANQTSSVRADKEGRWQTALTPLTAGGPYELLVTGNNTIKISDVLVGDVWLCSGQSNMAFHMRQIKDNPLYKDDLTTANFPKIRHGFVDKTRADKPLDSVPVAWTVCTPESVGEFTAAGFYFAREMHAALHVPIGLINSSVGGTSAQSWSSLESLQTDAHLKNMSEEQIAAFAKLPETIKNLPVQLADWEQKNGRVDGENSGEKLGWAAIDAPVTDWKTASATTSRKDLGLPDGGIIWVRKEITIPAEGAGKGFHVSLGRSSDLSCTAYFNGQKIMEKSTKLGLGDASLTSDMGKYNSIMFGVPQQSVKAGKNVIALRLVSNVGTGNFLGAKPSGWDMAFPGAKELSDDCQFKIERPFPPLSPEALAALPRGPNRDAGGTASFLFNGMIHPLAPFAISGLLWYQGEQDNARGHVYRTLLPLMISGWRKLWAQGDFPVIIQQLPNIGNAPKEPGPSSWAELREAQALTARTLPACSLTVAIDIGEAADIHPKNKRDIGHRLALAALANVYGRKMESSGPVYDSMTVEGSMVRLKFTHDDGLKSVDGKPLSQFAIAGDDKKFVWADAKIDGKTVLVSSAQVSQPVAVRYAWADNPEGCNLSNAGGLPAAPFRTDDWPGASDQTP